LIQLPCSLPKLVMGGVIYRLGYRIVYWRRFGKDKKRAYGKLP
jgi:hypothetical protein